MLPGRKKLGMTVVFITHDIGLAYYISDGMFIMSGGRIVEKGEPKQIVSSPKHDYTRELLSSIPTLNDDNWLK